MVKLSLAVGSPPWMVTAISAEGVTVAASSPSPRLTVKRSASAASKLKVNSSAFRVTATVPTPATTASIIVVVGGLDGDLVSQDAQSESEGACFEAGVGDRGAGVVAEAAVVSGGRRNAQHVIDGASARRIGVQAVGATQAGQREILGTGEGHRFAVDIDDTIGGHSGVGSVGERIDADRSLDDEAVGTGGPAGVDEEVVVVGAADRHADRIVAVSGVDGQAAGGGDVVDRNQSVSIDADGDRIGVDVGDRDGIVPGGAGDRDGVGTGAARWRRE